MMPATGSRSPIGTLRGRLILSVALVHAVMMALLVGDLTVRQRAMLLDRQIEQATALSHALATSAAGWIAAADLAGLHELVEAQDRYPELLFAILADRQGRVLAATETSRQGQYMPDLPREARPTVLSSSASMVDAVAPAMLGDFHVGWARVGIGQRKSAILLSRITWSGIVYALAAILIGSVIAWFLGRRITRKLYAVQMTIDAVRSGNRMARSPIYGADEAAVMAREFNTMLDALAERDAGLRAGEERYRSLIRKVQTAIVLHDGQGRLLDSNPMAQELLGLSSERLLGMTLDDPEWHFLREDGSVLPVGEYPASLVLSSRQPLRDYVTGISRPDRDETAWVLVNAEPEYGGAGEVERVIVSFMDISERRWTEQINMARLRLLQFAATHALDGLLQATLDEAETLSGSLIGFYHFIDAGEKTVSLQNWSTRTKASFCTAEGKGSHYDVSTAGVWVDCIRERRAVIHNDYASLSHRKGMPPGHAKVVRELVVPVFRADRIVAILGVGNKTNQYTQRDVDAVSLLADFAWEIVERKRAEEALLSLNRKLRAISSCNQVLMRAVDERNLLQAICGIVCDEAGYRMAWVGFAEDDDARTVHPAAWAGVEDGYLERAGITWADTERGRGPSGTAIRSGEL